MKLRNAQLPIIFIGFMGTGKTTVGQYLSDLQNLSYVDLDEYIEVNECKSIPEIFSNKGEHGFRYLESKYLTECFDSFDVISTGGGIIENSASLELLKRQNYVIWLDCDIDIIYRRIVNDPHRPNAMNKTLEQLKALYSSRISRYNEIAFMKVNSALTVSEIYQEIINELSSD
ncbi:shikimate kinase [Staphylococcus saccharolyticus]|uniref:shikimate kinase n=1 Tax=Staphylococcus saccharolyticus TaxID=33028 RepID=UPI003B75B63B